MANQSNLQQGVPGPENTQNPAELERAGIHLWLECHELAQHCRRPTHWQPGGRTGLVQGNFACGCSTTHVVLHQVHFPPADQVRIKVGDFYRSASDPARQPSLQAAKSTHSLTICRQHISMYRLLTPGPRQTLINHAAKLQQLNSPPDRVG